MARLLHWPEGLKANFREPLSGPRTISGGVTSTVGNFLQTTASPFGLWRWRFSFPPMRRQLFRRYRGWVTALHGGANATRVPFCDWDGLTHEQKGLSISRDQWKAGQPWGNGEPWSNDRNWKATSPVVPVTFGGERGGTTIGLSPNYWGDTLDYGDLIGFYPLHLGMYMITEVRGPGVYRIWPPLRKEVTSDDFATLEPVMAMRLESEDSATAPRSFAFSEGSMVTLVEVLDYDVREYFAEVSPPISNASFWEDNKWGGPSGTAAFSFDRWGVP